MKVSTTQFSLESLSDQESFFARCEKLIVSAKVEGSQLILFPEYFSLSWLLKKVGEASFRNNLLKANEVLREFTQRFQKWADAHDMVIVAGTVPVVDSVGHDDAIYNRCFVFRPQQEPLYQDKINMTRFEDEEWKVKGGGHLLKPFKVGDFLCAVATCYDVEFPAVCAMAAEVGVELLLVPSCTDDVHGYWRVRHCAQARTIENQCYVVMSSIVGGDPSRSEIESHYGQGGIFTPCDVGMPEGGVLCLGEKNAEGVVSGEIDRGELLRIRTNGTVLNLRDGRRH